MKITPMYDKVVITADETEDTTAGGIILLDDSQKAPVKGTVVAVGTGKITENGQVIRPRVDVGDYVLFGNYAATEVTLDKIKYLILKDTDIFAILTK